MNQEDSKIEHAYAECEAKVNSAVERWLERWIANEAIVVASPQDAWDLSVLRFELRRYCHPNNDREIEPHDLAIISECVAVGAEFIATHNFQSIDHARLNDWSRRSKGQNQDLIGGASDLSKLLLNSVRNELTVIGAMTASYEERSLEEASVIVVRFIGRLFESNYARLADETELTWEHMTREERASLLDTARELSKTPPFERARMMNEELLTIAQDARAEWNETAKDLGIATQFDTAP